MKKIQMIKLAKVIRSKNSGPFELTFDIIFKTRAIYEKIKKKKIISKAFVRRLYNVTGKKILNICYFEPAKAVKITIARSIGSGDVGETDVYGAQQHMPLVNAMINWGK
ncbi:MAG: acyl-CoA synthetase [Candidatus Firestonebacteria bacterium RIFOXYA2_FULL_40_8]|nr:MAG: acyl-CoA synthetase [Candidatus Firestonebacteria bacterium RIFOXYA2_FULL_40_8]